MGLVHGNIYGKITLSLVVYLRDLSIDDTLQGMIKGSIKVSSFIEVNPMHPSAFQLIEYAKEVARNGYVFAVASPSATSIAPSIATYYNTLQIVQILNNHDGLEKTVQIRAMLSYFDVDRDDAQFLVE
jgi:hypothetical protein